MNNILQTIAILACFTLSGTAMAQEAAPEPEPGTAADQAFPVAQDPIGEPFVKSTHGDWELRCITLDSGEECNMYQLLLDATGNPTAELNLAALPEGGQAIAGATFVSPLGTLLPRGIAFSIDSDRARRYNFTWCDRSGCIARFGFNAEEVGFMQEGKTGVFTIVALANPQEPVSLNLSLDGFKPAWAELTGNPE